MENATKGLMIAGAILIAIILIGIGVFLVTQVQGFMGEGGQQFDEMTKSSFNSPIEQYEGQQKGPNVRSLITHVNASNMTANQEGTYEEKGVNINFGSEIKGAQPIVGKLETYDSTAATKSRNAINTGKTYYVSIGYNNKTGLINVVGVSGVSQSEADALAVPESE